MVPESYRWEFVEQESDRVKQLAAETGYPEVFAGLLMARGVHNKEEAQRFLYPSEKNMYDPFLMMGWRQQFTGSARLWMPVRR